MVAYYNEHDPFAAEWLRELIKDGLIAPGDVDERSIEDVTPNDVKSYTQCHWFAGIGGWSRALRLAGWPDDRPVWTGSAPCQPFSQAGKRDGFADERHLWPSFLWHIRQCRPATVFGEQVSSTDGLEWWDVVADDLGHSGYTPTTFDLSAASVGTPHKRQRLYWMGYANEIGLQGIRTSWQQEPKTFAENASANGTSGNGRMVDAQHDKHGQNRRRHEETDRISAISRPSVRPGESGRTDGYLPFWDDIEWIECTDGKIRAIPPEPELFPLAYGIPNTVGILRGAGNAIVPQVAAAFIQSFMEVVNEAGSKPVLLRRFGRIVTSSAK